MATDLSNKSLQGIEIHKLPADSDFTIDRLGISANPDTGKLYKVTLQQWINLLSGLSVSYKGSATTSTDPGTPTDPEYYTATATGTYANFKDSDNTALAIADGDGFVIFSFDGTSWTKHIVDIPTPENKIADWVADAYSSGEQVNHSGQFWISNADTTEDEEPGISNKWSKLTTYTTLSDITDAIGLGTSDTLVVENFPESKCVFNYTSSSFSGWGSPIGNPQNFNSVKIKVRSRSAAITSIKFSLTTVNKSGTVLAEKEVITNISPISESDVTVVFDELITNGGAEQLYLSYACNELVDTFANSVDPMFTTPDYGVASYAINGVQTFPLVGTVVSDINFYTYIFLRESIISPDIAFSDAVAEKSTIIQGFTDTQNLTETALEWGGMQESTHNLFFPESEGAYKYATSTFIGWGSPIGNPQNFNSVRFKIRARASNTEDITTIRCWITLTDQHGTVLADKTLTGLSIGAGEESYFNCVFDAIISNSSGSQLAFTFYCDQEVDVFGLSGGGAVIATPKAWYNTITGATSPNTFTVVGDSADTVNIWVETFITSNGAKATDSFIDTLREQLDVIPDTKTLADYIIVDIVLPSRLFATSGTETNLYWENFIYSNFPLPELRLDVTCSKGQQFKDFYRITPVDGDAGSYAFQIDVYLGNNLIKTANSTLYITAASAGTGISRKVICVGDSTTAPGLYIAIINTDYLSDALGLTFLGTQGTAPNNHEGRGGWRVVDYATSGRQLYKFNVSGIMDAPGIGSVYSDGTRSFTVTEVNISSGSGYFSASKTGSGEPAASGTLTKTSGTGDISVTYSSNSMDSTNPFWNTGTSSLDFSGYLSDNSYTLSSDDWVTIYLGINDIFGYTSDADVTAFLPGMITNLRNLISNMRSAVSGLRIAVCITTPPASQDGFGYNYGTGQTQKQYLQNLKLLQQKFISEFDNDTERTAGNYLIPFNMILDTRHNMQHSAHNANARNSTDQIDMAINGVHPATSGYYQLGDQLWAFLKNMA